MPTDACADYLACASLETPWQLDDLDATYGSAGSCWAGDPVIAETCDAECATALAALVEETESAGDPVWAVCVGGTVGFESDIQPIFNDNCVDGCHEPGGVWSIFDLRPTRAYDSIVGVPAPSQAIHLNCVEPGDPDASYIWHKLSGTQLEVGGEGLQAPDDAAPLDDAVLEVIETWILEGAYL